MKHITLLLSLLLVGCSSPQVEEQQAIAFRAEAGELRAMQPGIVTSEHFHEDMGVIGYIHHGSWSTTTDRRIYFGPLRVLRRSGYTTGYPWPGEGGRALSFFAYAPFEAATCAGTDLAYRAETTEGTVDLVTASHRDVPSDYGEEVELPFRHPLTAISVVMNKQSIPTVIDRLELIGTAGEGSYSLSEERWTDLRGSHSYTIPGPVTHPEGATTDTEVTQEPLFILPRAATGDRPVLRVYVHTDEGVEPMEVSLESVSLEPGKHLVLRLLREEPGMELTMEVLPWTVEEYRKGFLSETSIQMVKSPIAVPEDLTVTDRSTRAELTIDFLRPVGVEWRATLTNGLDFEFVPGTPQGGTTDPYRSVTISVRPRRPQGYIERRTEIYLTLYGREIDPDRTLEGDGPMGIGKGRRYVIRQVALK